MPPKKIIWPTTFKEYEYRRAAAVDKYKPLVDNLQPWELDALAYCAEEALKELRKTMRTEDIRQGGRPPGTALGNRVE